LEEARKLIEQAVKIQPESSAFLDSLAWVLFKLNKPREALPPMLKAIENSKKPDATLFDHLGDIYTALQQHDKARAAWADALKVKPNEQIQRKFDASPAIRPSAP
jgi:tetratricopeptide (TPR) repeat protein